MVRRASTALVLAAACVMLALPAAAQTGGVRGKVIDASGNPVEGAHVVIQSKDSPRKFEQTTKKDGVFTQIGLFTGMYVITVTKDALKSEIETRVSMGDVGAVEIRLAPAAASEEHKKRVAELQKLFDEGVAAAKTEAYDVAIAKFEQTTVLVPTCADCYFNLGIVHLRNKDAAKAQLAYEKAAELYEKENRSSPNRTATWTDLANIYNATGQPEKALEASNKAAELSAAGGGTAGATGLSASALYNQGAILWNQDKYKEAKEKFEAAHQADPTHAEAQFMLGMAYLNVDGDVAKAVAAFEAYVKAAPSGPNAAKAKQFIADLKQ
jgi:tetratricopeptide (TPR) repeat protein